jgi:HAD superfamily phosphatase (TIGR01668 family)
MKALWPDWYFESIDSIPVGFFEKNRIAYLVSDIDNTLVSYDDPLPTPAALAFFDRLKRERVFLLLVSNNEKERVARFAKGLPYPFVSKAAKPSVSRISKMLSEYGVDLSRCAFLGDQLFTDCLAAKRLGIPMILVNPVAGDNGLPFFTVKRSLEKQILKGYLKSHPINCTCGRTGASK